MNNIEIKFCEEKRKHPGKYNLLEINNISNDITILLGPNGTGKSLSLMNIEENCKNIDDIECIRYSNNNEDIVKRGGWDWDPYKLACAFHSEGERICDSFEEWSQRVMLNKVLKSSNNLIILTDEIDSGLSLDRLYYQLKQYLFILDKEKKPSRKIKYVFTCNSYEMLEIFKNRNDVDIIWLPSKKRIKINSYNKFKEKYIEYGKYMFK